MPDANILTANLRNNATVTQLANAFVEDGFNCIVGDKTRLMASDGKTVYDTVSGLYYRIKIRFISTYNWTGDSSCWANNSTTSGANYLNYINTHIVRTGYPNGTLSGNLTDNQVGVYASQNLVYVTLEQNAIDVECVIDSTRAHLEDAPYDMFCIPYSDTLKIYDGTDTITCNKAIALSMASAIGEKGGTGSVFDVQLLPYCPCREAILRSAVPSDTLDISTISFDTIIQKGTNAKVGHVIWVPRSTFSFTIDDLADINYCKFATPYANLNTPTDIVPSKKYIAITNDLPTNVSNSYRIATLTNNNMLVYRVNKETGKIIEDFGAVSTIELININGSAYLRVYRGNDYQNPIYQQAPATYNAADWQFVFYIRVTSYGGANIESFKSHMMLTDIIYYDVDISTPINAKLTNECNLYRLSAGNQSSIFEFSPAKSFGFTGYKVDCTYKPFQPWIHIIPNLAGLYGNDFVTIDDARGLICGGDYSLTQLNNAWATYKLQNSTYQEMFDREIQHMDVQNSIQEQEQWAKAISGTITGGISGAVAGGLVGGP